MKLRLALPCAVAAALVAATPAAAFTPTNQYYAKQWYLAQDQAFSAWPTTPPIFQPVKVALIDSGLDCALPDFAGQIAQQKSFVGGSACQDSEGHGTVVAGEIAGALNSAGVVGLAYGAQLVVAKVVAPDGTIPLQAEADAIRWSVQQGARVINLSFGAVRDPIAPSLDAYSKLEAQAVAYAVRHGAVVVAAVGNSDEAYATPWPYASWPAALPHVIGVGALTRSGDVPAFSDQDPRFVDIAAPGVGIFSTFPRKLTDPQAGCTAQGYTDCASGDYRSPEGTSFAAPQVSAAAAVLLGLNPALTSSQVTTILERSADDVNPATGCPLCPVGRDKFSGWGSLDVAKAVEAVSPGVPLPPSDHFEPNDSVSQAFRLRGSRPVVGATLDYWDDVVDFYRVKLARGQRLLARVRARPTVSLIIRGSSRRLAQTASPGQNEHLSIRARRTGWYYVEVRIARPGAGRYTLRLNKTS
ncbi:MAG TPA: S8 family serine peptidase [Gaiellaceae bacterium]|nr:S8 family serine peptidase [Gaiellaceae bacterium]